MSHSLSRSMSRLSLTANPTTTLKRTAQTSNNSSIRFQSSSSSLPSSTSLFIPSTSRNLIPRSNRNLQIRSRSYASHAPATLTLGNLKPAQPSKNRKRLGRGPSSGRGGTATRGHKGQKARRGNGKPTPGFEGGQTPIVRRYPKRGFTNIHSKTYVPLNLDRLQHWIDRGLIDPSQPITTKELLDSRCIHSVKDGVKILGDGSKHLSQPISILVSKASTSAIQAIESLGGSITCRYYTPLTLRALTKPHKWTDLGRIVPRGSDPTGKRDLLYYSDPRKRGYLAKRSAIIKAQQAQEEASKVVEASEEK